MESLEYIEDESTLNSLVSILVCLLPVLEKKSSDTTIIENNAILHEFVKKESYFREKLIFLTNRGAYYRLDKCCKVLNIILKKEELANFYFNTNDLNLIMDIMLREALTNPSSKTRVQILRLIETILDNEIYREYSHRI